MVPAVVFESMQRARELVEACMVQNKRRAGAHAEVLTRDEEVEGFTLRRYAVTCPRCVMLARGMRSGGFETTVDELSWERGAQ